MGNYFDLVSSISNNWGLFAVLGMFLFLWLACLSGCTLEYLYSLLVMSCLSWNCRGMGNPQSVRALRNLVQQWNPNIVFLMETKIGVNRMEKVKEIIGLANGLIVPSEGKSGGIALLWVRGLDVEIKSYTRSHIDAIVTDSVKGFKWRITGFYGNPDTNQRRESWNLLHFLNAQYQLPWVCLGDFNEILKVSEKWGGPERTQQQMEGFRRVVHTCGFQDLGFEGLEFTWSNWRSEEERISLRLDRVLATTEWKEKYRDAKVFHVVESTSDHCAIILTNQQGRRRRKTRRFHFEAIWVRHEKCREIIQESWKDHAGLQSSSELINGLKACTEGLKRWSQQELGQVTKKIQEKRKILQDVVQADRNGSRGDEIDMLCKEINELLDDEEMRWNQRSRVQWLKLGDRNTQYFHHRASQRQKKNEIKGLLDRNGRWCEDLGDIAEIAIDYFTELFQTPHPTRVVEVARTAPRVVSKEMNEQLTKEFQKEEVLQVISQMHLTKALGPNGMSAIFYQKHWDIIGEDVTNTMLSILNSNSSLAELNQTNIVLIPKTNNPTKMCEFRPISLCNVSYKIISKVLANRLKPILNGIISENQSAFVPGRLITDNVLVAFEVMHYLKNKRDGKDKYMAVKLDMSKTYDRVEWGFLCNIMTTMGFKDRWISLMMNCISTVSYSILINGVSQGCIFPSRGLRQGDPLSPYLFLICAEGLTGLIGEAVRNKNLSGISISRGYPTITHLLFADDCVIYCKANGQESRELRNILQQYEDATG